MGTAPDRPVTPRWTSRRLWPDSEHGPWEITLYWMNMDGETQVIGVDLRSFTGDWMGARGGSRRKPLEPIGSDFVGMDASLWRTFRFREVADASWQHLLESTERRAARSSNPGVALKNLRLDLGSRRGGRGGRPPQLGPDTYAEVARVYGEARAQRRHPTKAVSKHFVISHSAAAKRVGRARALGLLPPTTRGKAK